jgi:hypothetical protein
MSMCLIQPHTMGELDIKLHAFLSLALDEGGWLASCSDQFTYRERAFDIHCIWDWLGGGAEPVWAQGPLLGLQLSRS